MPTSLTDCSKPVMPINAMPHRKNWKRCVRISALQSNPCVTMVAGGTETPAMHRQTRLSRSRLKTPQDGRSTIDDLVQGSVSVQNSEIDDYVILRADGSPTLYAGCRRGRSRHGLHAHHSRRRPSEQRLPPATDIFRHGTRSKAVGRARIMRIFR